MEDFIGKQFGQYKIINLLGDGGFAEVYLGEHVNLGTQAAVKILKPMYRAEEHINRFKLEARRMQDLRHQHIVGIEEAATANN